MKSLLPPSVDQWMAMQVMGSLTGKVARAPAWTVVAAEKCAEKGEISPERRAASKSTHRNAEIGHWKEDDKWKGLQWSTILVIRLPRITYALIPYNNVLLCNVVT